MSEFHMNPQETEDFEANKREWEAEEMVGRTMSPDDDDIDSGATSSWWEGRERDSTLAAGEPGSYTDEAIRREIEDHQPEIVKVPSGPGAAVDSVLARVEWLEMNLGLATSNVDRLLGVVEKHEGRLAELEVAASERLSAHETHQAAIALLVEGQNDQAVKYNASIQMVLSIKDSFDGLLTAVDTGMKPMSIVSFVRHHVENAAQARGSRVAGAQAVARRSGLVVVRDEKS